MSNCHYRIPKQRNGNVIGRGVAQRRAGRDGISSLKLG